MRLYERDMIRFEILSDKVLFYAHCGFTDLRIITILLCIYVLFKKVSLHQPWCFLLVDTWPTSSTPK